MNPNGWVMQLALAIGLLSSVLVAEVAQEHPSMCDDGGQCAGSDEDGAFLQVQPASTRRDRKDKDDSGDGSNGKGSSSVKECADADKWPGIGWAAKGFNIYKANAFPSTGGADAGFGAKVFDITYDLGTGTGAGCAPDGYDVTRNTGSSLSISTDLVESSGEYTEEVTSSFSIGGSGSAEGKGSVSGSYSSDSSTYGEMVTTKKMKMVVSKAAWSSYNVNTGKGGAAPPANYGFTSSIAAAYSQDDYQRLFEDFGTHYAADVQMGGRFYETYYISEEGYKQVNDAEGSRGFEAEAELDAAKSAAVKAEASSESSIGQGSDKMSDSIKERRVVFIVGGKLKEQCNGALAWEQALDIDPLPIKLDLRSICSHPAFLADANKAETCESAFIVYREHMEARDPMVDPECVWDLDCTSGGKQLCRNSKCVEEPGCKVTFHRDTMYQGFLNTYGPFRKTDERGGNKGYLFREITATTRDEVSSVSLTGACKKIKMLDFDSPNTWTSCQETESGSIQNVVYEQEGTALKKPGEEWGMPDLPHDIDDDTCGFVVWTHSWEELHP